MQRNLSKTKLKVKKFMTSKPVQMGMLILIIVYSLLVFINLAIDDIIEDEDESAEVVKDLEIVELIILIIFTAEIIASAYGQGWIVTLSLSLGFFDRPHSALPLPFPLFSSLLQKKAELLRLLSLDREREVRFLICCGAIRLIPKMSVFLFPRTHCPAIAGEVYTVSHAHSNNSFLPHSEIFQR